MDFCGNNNGGLLHNVARGVCQYPVASLTFEICFLTVTYLGASEEYTVFYTDGFSYSKFLAISSSNVGNTKLCSFFH